MCRVSIIIPVYNVEKYLENSINSVLGQTLDSIEVVCVDDGSTDGSLDILQGYARKDKRLKVISLGENRGQAYARNRGLEQAKGEYIYFLDSDDMIVAEAMEVLYTEAKKYDLDCVVFEGKVQYECEQLSLLGGGNLKKRGYAGIRSGKELFEEFLVNKEFNVSPCLHFLRRNFLEKFNIKFREGIITEDNLWCVCVYWNCERMKVLNKILFTYNLRANSTTTGSNGLKRFCGVFTSSYYILKQVGAYTSEAFERWISTRYAEIIVDKRCACLKSDEIKAELQNEELKIAYSVFDASRKLYATHGIFSDSFKECIRRYRDVYIYGAGEIARSVFAGIVLEDIPIKGFLVSAREGNPNTIEGHLVKIIDDFSCENVEQTIIIIAVSKFYQKQVIECIKRICKNVKCIVYDE